MSRKQIVIAVIAAIIVVAGGVGAYFYFSDSDENPAPEQAASEGPVPEAKGPVPDPVMLVVDKGAILQASKAGQDIGRQVQSYAMGVRSQLEPQAKALRAEQDALKAQIANLSPDERQRRIAAYDAKEEAFQRTTQVKEAAIKQAVSAAQKQLSAKMGPILKQIMSERHANLIVDKQAVMFATDPSLDVSAEAVKRLDQVLPAQPVQFPQQ